MGESALLAWLAERRRASTLTVRPISWAECTPWRFRDGRLEHESGYFFSIAGVRAASNVPELDRLATPIINQPEVGILAFLLRERGGGYEWLMQAKAEPGTVERVQLAPSVQATESNFEQRHGGEPTRYLDLVKDMRTGGGRIADIAQSEQGSMFLNKYNRNVAQIADVEADGWWRWATSAELRDLLGRDYALNTDARSVLVSAPWRFLSATGTPFAASGDPWQAKLAGSYGARGGTDALGALESRRAGTTLSIVPVALDALPACNISDRDIVSAVRAPALTISAFHVDAPNHERETEQWNQPLVARAAQSATLVCAVRDGVLKFFLRFSAEIGFRDHKVEFGPSLQSDAYTPSPSWLVTAAAEGATHAVIHQSDEGGRFWQCITRYAICEIPEASTREDEGGVWVTLGDLERLAAVRGALTNEARSLVSMLLAWA